MRLNTTLGAILLLAGTCIGAAMLALPVVVAPLGLWGGMLVLVLCWWFMYYTGLLTLEANVHLPPGSNFISMADQILGVTWKILTVGMYVLLLYALMAAYFTALVDLLIDLVPVWASLRILITTVLAVFIMLVIALGTRYTDIINRLFVVVLVVSYLSLLVLLASHMHAGVAPVVVHGSALWPVSAVVLTAFGYHVLIPNLRVYLRSDVARLKRVVLYGSLLPLVIYVLWTVVLYRVLPSVGPNSLMSMWHDAKPEVAVIHAIRAVTNALWSSRSVQCFIFCAVMSSLLGVALSMVHFMRDGLISQAALPAKKAASFALLLAFLPPWLFANFYAHGFIVALGFAGIFVAFLHGILPGMMVYSIRRRAHHAGTSVASKQNALWPAVVMVLSLVLIVIQSIALAGKLIH
jgi:tyrosine-specific transport protein